MGETTDVGEPDDTAGGPTGDLLDPEGAEVGTFTMTEAEDGVEVTVSVEGLTEGFHGLHVHESGLCEPDSSPPDDPSETGDFLSAGGHLAEGEQRHGEHAGDLPSLAVGADGRGTLTFVTSGLTLADVQDDDGSAVMVHAERDNDANIPDRYATEGPDEDTLDTGDSGDRIACGIVGGG